MSDHTAMRTLVLQALESALRNSGRELPANPSDEDRLAESFGLDSLDFALAVVELERLTGYDPFRKGGRAVRTLGDLVQLYSQS
jgi:acyl carrier protein